MARSKTRSKTPDCIVISPDGEHFPAFFVADPSNRQTAYDRMVEYKPTPRSKPVQVEATAVQWAEGGWRWRPVTTDD